MKPLLKLIIAILLPFTTLGHGYWIELQGSHKVNEPVTIRLYFGEYSIGERLSDNFLDRMKDIKVYIQHNGTKEDVTMTQQKDYWEGTYTPQNEGSYEIIGINDERDVQDWTQHGLGIVRPIQYLKAIYQAGPQQSVLKASSFLDVIVSGKDGRYFIKLYKNSQVNASAKLTVTHPNGEETSLETDEEGNAVFTATTPGLYLIGAEWIDPVPGKFKGKDYKTVRHKLDYSLYHL